MNREHNKKVSFIKKSKFSIIAIATLVATLVILVYETKINSLWYLVTVIVEEDLINTPFSSPGAFIRHYNTN